MNESTRGLHLHDDQLPRFVYLFQKFKPFDSYFENGTVIEVILNVCFDVVLISLLLNFWLVYSC